jgi:hypothetical protein
MLYEVLPSLGGLNRAFATIFIRAVACLQDGHR